MKALSRIVCLLLLALALPVSAQEAAPLSDMDPVLQARMDELTKELRCLKCQNQTIYDSKAGLADDLKRQIRIQIEKGKSDEEVVEYLVSRYGEFVLYRPRFDAQTFFVWVGPFILLIVGVVVLVVTIRKRRQLIDDSPLSEQDEKRVQDLLREQAGDK
ncbi:MAG: cytochrome c-type biogenesis protein CcmH [Gammaproteobacteria bacterium]|nr:cytochrome c-type biogenesis protein CcmH [Gammaproteobacteria bacterium]